MMGVRSHKLVVELFVAQFLTLLNKCSVFASDKVRTGWWGRDKKDDRRQRHETEVR
jgi:hypothetical protein